MQIITPKQKRLAGLIAMVGFGAIAQLVQSDRTPLYGIGTDEDALHAREPELLGGPKHESSEPILAPEDGFNAFEDKDPPPAELLALGDWPLDPRRPQAAGTLPVQAAGTLPVQAASSSQPDPVEAQAHADEASALAQVGARAQATEAVPAKTAQEQALPEAIASDEKGPLEQFSPVLVSPVAAAAFPQVIEADARASQAQTTEGMMEALIAAFDASGRAKPAIPAVAPRSESSHAQASDPAPSAEASAQTTAAQDKAQDFLQSVGLAAQFEKAEVAVTQGIKQVVSKSRDLLGEFVAFLGFGTTEKQPTALVKADKQEEAAPEDIPAVPNDARVNALASAPGKSEVFGDERIVLSAASLDDMRGGFIDGNGLQLSFGIERATYINGNLVAQTSLNFDSLAAASARGTTNANVADATGVKLIQALPGNEVKVTNLSQSGFGQIIQNNLNNQDIKSVTTVTAAVNSVQMLRSIRFNEAILSGLTGK